jgi:acyl-CoA thioesterase FadM
MPAPLQIHDQLIEVTEADLPEDRFSDHVNNARYFAFVNRTFQSWYRAMGIRGGVPGQAAVMARIEWDFVSEVKPPGIVRCRIEVTSVGRSSLEHAVRIDDLGRDGRTEPRLAGRGRVVHVWIDRAARASRPWPAEVLARCWSPPGAPEGAAR